MEERKQIINQFALAMMQAINKATEDGALSSDLIAAMECFKFKLVKDTVERIEE